MDSSPWLILRQAAEAVANSRPDDAHRLIAPLLEEGYRKAWRAARDVANGYCVRAMKALDRDNVDAAWDDLLAAESLNTGAKCAADLRQKLTRFGLVQARAALEAGDPATAGKVAARLRQRGVRHRDLPPIEDAVREWIAAAYKADRGDFLPAIDDLHGLRSRLPCPPDGLERFRAILHDRHARFVDAFSRAQQAAASRQWRDAVVAADEALAAAPEYHIARTLRTKAWQAVYPDAAAETGSYPSPANPAAAAPDDFAVTKSFPAAAIESSPAHGSAGFAAASPVLTVKSPRTAPRPVRAGPSASPYDPQWDRRDEPEPGSRAGDPSMGTSRGGSRERGSDRSSLPKRFLLWVDGVAGYLVCTTPRVTFGQAVLEGGPVDVPLVADVSRVHAELTRDGEGYLVESGKPAPVNGKEVARTVLVNGQEVSRSVLAAGDRVTLGSTCQFVFHKPVGISSTASLQITSGHRLILPVEGILLMSNDIILGPGPEAHVVVRSLHAAVILYRSKDGLGVRHAGKKFAVNDEQYLDRAPLPLPGSFDSDFVSFSVEPVGPRL
jgi:hypothetical protein